MEPGVAVGVAVQPYPISWGLSSPPDQAFCVVLLIWRARKPADVRVPAWCLVSVELLAFGVASQVRLMGPGPVKLKL